MCGSASAIVAGGAESMSLIPWAATVAPGPTLVDNYPRASYLSTGLVAGNRAQSAISREEQDAFAFRSHQRALAIDATLRR